MKAFLVPSNTPFPLTDALPSKVKRLEISPLDLPIESLDLSVRGWSALRYAGIKTINELAEVILRHDLLLIRNIGVVTRQEIIEKIEAYIA